jgi:3-oxoacyl-[acyl-carrier protein] reductase
MKLFTATLFALLSGSATAFSPSSAFTLSTSNIASGIQSASTTSTTLSMVAEDAKVVLVTGASRGLGRSIAVEMGQQGQKVIVNYAGSEDAANETVEMVKAAGGDAVAIQANCGDPNDIKELFAKSVEAFGTVDVLINNAGITKDTLVMRMKPAQWQDVIDINLSGVFYCTQAFFKLAAKKRTGRIINISSVVGQIGNPGQANYAAAKARVIGLTKSNAKEFSTRGVTVNCICPGFIESDMTAKLSDEYLEEVSKGIPLGRLGKATEIAGMTRFLALDDAADYITGHTFNVDGGIAIGC